MSLASTEKPKEIICPNCLVPGWVRRSEDGHKAAWSVSDGFYLRVANAYRMGRPQIVCGGCGRVVSS